jgi:hypothetical protein
MEGVWLIDSGCSRHMIEDRIQPRPGDEQRVHHFWDNGIGRVLSVGTVKLSYSVTLRRVSLVKSLG